ncbi:MAG TPA: SurA N-terminal domain-containing protein [Coxiellaceae bacterium]|nr:MAG: hypothetical protein A3E81_00450 [Gammaproteobacteria bacterium RIFCSPHIGHO2_12_FULL_36_30]HLB56630.1 SurA N-terminal domain-containing protein [Coxiellaceae bacterium]
MLQRIRDRISGWIAGVVIALVAGAFMLFGVEYYFDQGAANQNEMAKVNGVVITDHEVNTAFSQLQQQTAAELKGQPLTQPMLQQLKSYALQSLVTQTALFTTLESDGFRVSMQQVKMMVEQVPQFQDQGKFSEQKFMQTLYQSGLSPFEFFQRVQSQWVVSQATNGIAGSAFALPTEINHWYGLQNQQRAFGYAIIPAQTFLSKINISDAAIKTYYTDHQAEFETPAKVSVSYIILSPTDIAKKVIITSDEAKQYYESHRDNFPKTETFASAEKKITTLLQHQRVNASLTKESSTLADVTYTNPDSLTDAAKALNLPIQTSPMITKTGEKTGLFANAKVLAAIFSDSVFKSNNNSLPIDLGDGSQMVLRINKKEPSEPIPLSTVNAKIKTILSEKQAQAQAGLLAYQIQQKIAAGGNPETIAKQNGLQWQTVALTSQNAKSSVSQNILSAAFNTVGSKAVLVNANDYAVIKVNQIKNADAKNITAVETKKLNQQLSALWGQLLQSSFVNSVIADAHITVKNQS